MSWKSMESPSTSATKSHPLTKPRGTGDKFQPTELDLFPGERRSQQFRQFPKSGIFLGGGSDENLDPEGHSWWSNTPMLNPKCTMNVSLIGKSWKSKPYPKLTCELPPLVYPPVESNVAMENPIGKSIYCKWRFFSWESHRFPWYIGISNYPRPTQRHFFSKGQPIYRDQEAPSNKAISKIPNIPSSCLS